MKLISQLSLRDLFIFITMGLLFPALIFSFSGVSNARDVRLDQVRSEVDQINQMINESVNAPFYMSPRASDPCNPDLLKLVNYPAEWNVEYLYDGKNNVTCEWIYSKDEKKVAIDRWNNYDRKLASREYFQNGDKTLATDVFFVLDDEYQVTCIKQRKYENPDVTECYSEAGELISIDPMSFYSPLPPMLYWFAYR